MSERPDSAVWRYRAATADGRVVQGWLAESSRSEAMVALRRQALVPIALEPVQAQAPAAIARAPRSAWIVAAAPGLDAVALWLRSLATLVGAGVPLARALGGSAVLVESAPLASAIERARATVMGGAPLSAALREHLALLPDAVVALVAAGEESGRMGEALGHGAELLETRAALRAQLRGALLYPLLVGLAAGVGVVVLLVAVVPRFAAMLADLGGSLPLSTRLLIGASDVARAWGWLAIPLGVIAAIAWRAAGADPAARLARDRRLLALPVIGPLRRTIATGRSARILALLLESGSPLVPALQAAARGADDRAHGAELAAVAEGVREGRPLARAIEGVVPPLAAQLLVAGDEAGTLPAMARRVADTYDAEVARRLRTLIALVEPVLILLFGGVVGFVALAMLQAIYSVNASVR